MARVPAYGEWYDQNAGMDSNITERFQIASNIRKHGPPIYHTLNKHKMESNSPDSGYDKNDNWETGSTKSVPDSFTLHPQPPGQRNNNDANQNNPRGSKLPRGNKMPIGYDKDDNWEDNFIPKSPSVGYNRTDKRETVSTKNVHDNITLKTRNPEGHAQINIRNKSVPEDIIVKTRLPEGYARMNIRDKNQDPKQPKVGYENNPTPNRQIESIKENPINFIPQTRLPQGSQLPKGPKPQLVGYDNNNDREMVNNKIIPEIFIRASSSSGGNNWQKNYNLPKGPTTRTGHDDKLRNDIKPAGYDHNLAIQAPHDRKPSSSNERSNLKPKIGPSAPKFGKWNVDPNCSQEFTKKFIEVRSEREKRIMEEPNDSEQVHSYRENIPEIKKKRRNWFFEIIRRALKRLSHNF